MTVEEITRKLEMDSRNANYTERNIPPVFQIHKDARVFIIGQAPGRKVEESLIPFHDKSGQKLMEWMGISEEIFYSSKVAIVPMDFYYPGKGKTGDLPPRKFIAEEYHPEILAMMPEIRLTILIGQYAMKHYLTTAMKQNLTETVRNFESYLPKYFPIVHPSPLNFRWQRKNSWFEEQVIPVLQRVIQEVI
jgi:uracil-DNA glycosylase